MTWIISGTHPNTGVIHTIETTSAIDALDTEIDLIAAGYTTVRIDPK